MNIFPKELLPINPKILIIKLRSIGDVIYNTAIYSPIKKTWPKAHLAVVVELPSYDIVKHHPDVDKVWILQKGSLFNQFNFYWKLFRERYDVAIDMHEGPRGAIMCFLTGASHRVGNSFAKRALFYNVKLNFSEFAPKLPIDYQIGLVKKMGVIVEQALPAVHIAQESRAKARFLLTEHGIGPEDQYCIVHPGARIYDQWQNEKFADLADQLYAKHGLKIVLAYGPGQEGQAKAVKKKIQSAPHAFIKTGLQELGAITERARFVVCHNGGYMHLVAALGTPVIALFGLSNPAIWRPLGEGHKILHHKLDCFPCTSKTIRDICSAGRPECKERITLDEVMGAAEEILKIPSKIPSQE